MSVFDVTPEAIGVIGIVSILVLLLYRVPIGLSLGIVSFFGIWALVGQRAALGAVAEIPYDFTAHWSLSSIPMFLLMGYIAVRADLSAGLFRLARLWLSWLPGGLGVASVVSAGMFSAASGSSLAASAALARIATPEMLKYGYHPGLATGIAAAAGTMGSLIPPSILLILYGVFVGVPISHLFIAGLAAGLVTVTVYCAVIIIRAIVTPEIAPKPPAEESTMGKRLAALWELWPLVVLIGGVLGGMFAGIFTATEAGALGAFLSIAIALVKRTLTWEKFRLSVLETVTTTSAIFLIAIGASLMTRFMAFSGIPGALAGLITGFVTNQVQLVLLIAPVLVVLGLFLDAIGMLLIMVPVLLPVLMSIGVDLIWFGIIAIKFIEIGLVTPPVGLNVYVVKGVVGHLVPTHVIFKGIAWFVVADMVVIGLLIAFPQLAMSWVPK